MNTINLAKFDFDNIKNNNDISENLYYDDKCFLAYVSIKHKCDTIKRDGDLFYGVKNNEHTDIQITFFFNYHKIQTLIIKSGEIGYIDTPLFMFLCRRNNPFNYKIKKLNCYNFMSSHCNINFIYGYLTELIRNKLSFDDHAPQLKK